MQRAEKTSPQRGQGAVRPQPGEVWAFHGLRTGCGTVGPIEIEVASVTGGMVTGFVRGTRRLIHASQSTTWKRVS